MEKAQPWYTKMSIFRRGSLKLTDPTKTLKGQYLGNVSTNVAKGEHCIDRPLSLLWSNYVKTSGKQTVEMTVSVDNSGLKVITSSQGLTHYWCHRISYYCVSKNQKKLVVWIYRHVAKNLKVDLRCHAILLASERKAQSLVELLSEKMTASLQEYKREKILKTHRRLLHEKAAAHLSQHGEGHGQANRTRLLATSKNYKPPTEYSMASPTLHVISEEKDDSSDEEYDAQESAYSTLGRWTFKNKIHKSSEGLESSVPDVNMNQLTDETDYDPEDYGNLNGFLTMPRHRSHQTQQIQADFLSQKLNKLKLGCTDMYNGVDDVDSSRCLNASTDTTSLPIMPVISKELVNTGTGDDIKAGTTFHNNIPYHNSNGFTNVNHHSVSQGVACISWGKDDLFEGSSEQSHLKTLVTKPNLLLHSLDSDSLLISEKYDNEIGQPTSGDDLQSINQLDKALQITCPKINRTDGNHKDFYITEALDNVLKEHDDSDKITPSSESQSDVESDFTDCLDSNYSDNTDFYCSDSEIEIVAFITRL